MNTWKSFLALTVAGMIVTGPAWAQSQQEEDKRTGVRRRYKWDFDPYMDIFECDLDGNILRQLTNTPGYDAEGAYSKDGKLIAFCSDRDGFSATNAIPSAYWTTTTLRPRAMPLRA